MKNILLLSVLALLGSAATYAADPAPRAITTVMPVAPAELDGVNGHVDLLVAINAHGLVTSASVQNSTHPSLARACLDVIRQWRFAPALQDGQPVAAHFLQPIYFVDGLIAAADFRPPAILPKAVHRVAPVLPDMMQHVTGHAIVAVDLDVAGHVTKATVASSSHDELNAPCLQAIREWTFTPAMENSQAVATHVEVPFRFVGAALSNDTIVQLPRVQAGELAPLRQQNVSLPEELTRISGEAEISFVVDRHGYVAAARVASATQPDFGNLARQAVLAWKFSPPMVAGHTTAVRVVQPFRFMQGLVSIDPVAAFDKLPVATVRVQPVLPEALRDVAGSVLVDFAIDVGGRVTAVASKDATLPELVEPALAAARQWKFRAALKDGQPAAARVSVPFVFGG